ncbi:EAL domain-containing protein, partial [Citrobacter freundii]
RLELEITENVTISNPDITLETMKQLKDIGVRFLIDDFATVPNLTHQARQASR